MTARKFISATLERARAGDPFLSFMIDRAPDVRAVPPACIARGSALRKRNYSAIMPSLTHLRTRVGGRMSPSCVRPGWASKRGTVLRATLLLLPRAAAVFPLEKIDPHTEIRL